MSSFCSFLPQFLCLGSIHSAVEADCQGYARGRGLGWLDVVGGGVSRGKGWVGVCRVDLRLCKGLWVGLCRQRFIWKSVRAACLNRGGWEVGLGRSRMHPTVLLCALTSVCVCVHVYGKEVAAVVWAYVRSCAHIHQWNVKRKEEGSVLGLLVFCSLFPLCCSVGLFVLALYRIERTTEPSRWNKNQPHLLVWKMILFILFGPGRSTSFDRRGIKALSRSRSFPRNIICISTPLPLCTQSSFINRSYKVSRQHEWKMQFSLLFPPFSFSTSSKLQ